MVAYRYGDWKIVFCKLPDGTDVSAWLVRQGWALATGFIKTYESEQDEAEAAHMGGQLHAAVEMAAGAPALSAAKRRDKL